MTDKQEDSQIGHTFNDKCSFGERDNGICWCDTHNTWGCWVHGREYQKLLEHISRKNKEKEFVEKNVDIGPFGPWGPGAYSSHGATS